MALLELSDHLGTCQSLTPGQHQRELGTPMAQVQSDKERGRVRGIALLHQHLAALLFEGDHPLGELIQERLAQGLTQMLLQPSTLTRLPHAIGRKNTRHRVQQDGVQGQLIGQSAGMLPAGTAIGDQYPTANVLPTVQGHPSNRIGHPLNGQLQGSLRQLLRTAAQLGGECREGLFHHAQIRR